MDIKSLKLRVITVGICIALLVAGLMYVYHSYVNPEFPDDDIAALCSWDYKNPDPSLFLLKRDNNFILTDQKDHGVFVILQGYSGESCPLTDYPSQLIDLLKEAGMNYPKTETPQKIHLDEWQGVQINHQYYLLWNAKKLYEIVIIYDAPSVPTLPGPEDIVKHLEITSPFSGEKNLVLSNHHDCIVGKKISFPLPDDWKIHNQNFISSPDGLILKIYDYDLYHKDTNQKRDIDHRIKDILYSHEQQGLKTQTRNVKNVIWNGWSGNFYDLEIGGYTVNCLFIKDKKTILMFWMLNWKQRKLDENHSLKLFESIVNSMNYVK